jgi:hypothetical protein
MPQAVKRYVPEPGRPGEPRPRLRQHGRRVVDAVASVHDHVKVLPRGSELQPASVLRDAVPADTDARALHIKRLHRDDPLECCATPTRASPLGASTPRSPTRSPTGAGRTSRSAASHVRGRAHGQEGASLHVRGHESQRHGGVW